MNLTITARENKATFGLGLCIVVYLGQVWLYLGPHRVRSLFVQNVFIHFGFRLALYRSGQKLGLILAS